MAECTYFGTCGGCSYQDLPYEAQLELKQKMVEEALRHPEQSEGSAVLDSSATPQNDGNFEVHPIIGSPKPYEYRHMIALSVKRRQGQLAMGFIGNDRRTFLPIESCPITDSRINQFLPAALQKLEALPPERKFNTSQVVLRVGTDGEVVTSIRTDRGKLLSCSILGKTFSFSMSSFFQNNFSILELFIEAIRVMLSEAKHPVRDPSASPQDDGVYKAGTLFDLYSGVGLIGILLSEHYRSVIGIEEGYEAVKQAGENAVRNGIKNTSFIEGKVENLLMELSRKLPHPIHVVVDPPRIGLKPEVVEALIKTDLPIQKLVYVSCHLDALKRDLGLLTKRFRIVRIQPLDFFPQTKHIETLALLEPIN